MNTDQIPTPAKLRIFALTAAVASILNHLPAAKAELLRIADKLDDAPPIAVSDEMLSSFSKEIREVIEGKWESESQ